MGGEAAGRRGAGGGGGGNSHLGSRGTATVLRAAAENLPRSVPALTQSIGFATRFAGAPSPSPSPSAGGGGASAPSSPSSAAASASS